MNAVSFDLPFPDKVLWPNGSPNPITAEVMAEARRLFTYDKNTGLFIRRVRSGMRGKVGVVAGRADQGYIRLRVLGGSYAAHRLAWAWEGGAEPKGQIDHINGDRADNRIKNLRDVDVPTNRENQRNARADNSLGVQGVRRRPTGRYEARLWVEGRSIQLGTFLSAEAASAAYVAEKRNRHRGCTI